MTQIRLEGITVRFGESVNSEDIYLFDPRDETRVQ